MQGLRAQLAAREMVVRSLQDEVRVEPDCQLYEVCRASKCMLRAWSFSSHVQRGGSELSWGSGLTLGNYSL